MGQLTRHTAFVPEKEEFLQSKRQFLAHIDVAMWGRAAEELFCAKEGVTTGCGSDLRSATMTAYRMLLAGAMGRDLLTTDLEELSERKKEEVEGEVRQLLEVG